MLQAPSPTKATVWPARLPRCSRTVSRSASSWHGWNSSVRALTTGTPAYAAISSRSLWAKVRHTTTARLPAQDPGHVLDRLALADPRERAVDQHRVPAELGDPGGERGLGAQRRLVVDGRHRLRPGQRFGAVRRPLELRGQGQQLGPARPATGRRLPGSDGSSVCSRRLVEDAAGQAARNASASASLRVSGGASRIRSGVGLLTRNPRSWAAAMTSAECGVGEVERRSAARRARTSITRGSARSPAASRCTEGLGALEQPLLLDRRRGRRGRPRTRPGCRRRWCRGCRAGAGAAASPMARQAPIGMPPARPLARVTTSGVHRVAERRGWVGEPGAGPADAGLHLVEPEQRTVPVGDLRAAAR